MRTITLFNPNKVVFGNGCLKQFIDYFISLGYKRTLIITTPPVVSLFDELLSAFKNGGIKTEIDDSIESEPTIKTLESSLKIAEKTEADSVIGIGGGSALDVAKLVAALYKNSQTINEVIGIGKLQSRHTFLACLPTTSGTGSEVSPNAILLDQSDNLKKGVVSPFLVPDASYIDPFLTRSVPPSVTASTGMDALTHCLEAYTNKYAHPVVDIYALEGVKVIAKNLIQAYKNGKDEIAREQVSLGSFFGGLCLGPVNTAAVHALSYPLGGEYHIPHGLSNAVLLPYVMRFNIKALPEKYANIARALGSEVVSSNEIIAEDGVRLIFEIMEAINIPKKLSKLDIPNDAIKSLADSAMKVTRLLVNNPRELKLDDALNIFNEAY